MSLNRSFALFLLGIATASAQRPAEAPANGVPPPSVPVPENNATPAAGAPANQVPPPGVPVRGNRPVPAAGAPAGAPPAIPLGETKITEPIEELKLSGDALAGLYRKYTGRRVIVSSAASTAEFRFVQDASPSDPLTFAEAAELLRKAAILENFVFVPDGENPNLDILTVATGGTNPKGIGLGVYNEQGPVSVYNEYKALPDGDAVISYVMTLNYIKPADAQNAFVSIIGQFGAYGSITAVPNASALVITENTSLIRKLIDLKKEIDKPGSVQATRFIKVQYADVTEIADTLTTLLTAQQSTQKTAGIQRADSAPVPGGAPQIAGQPGGVSSGEDTPVQIIPDPRTNRIFAMGRPVDLVFVEGLVREFDVETSEKIFLRRKLKFLPVSDFLNVAEQALTRAFSGTGDSGGGGTSGGAAGGSTSGRSQSSGRSSSSSGRSNSSGSSGANSGGSSGSSGSGFGGSGSSSGGGGGASNALTAPDNNTVPEARLVGRTLLVADNITNSIVVQGPPSGLEIVERLLDQLDVKPDQVIISTVIGQLTLDDSLDFGINYLLNDSNFKLGGGGSTSGNLLPPADGAKVRFPRFDPASLSGSGLRALGTVGDLEMYLKALQTKSDFTVLSRPSIFTANNKKGTISSGERIAIPTSSNSFTNGGASTNIEYQDVVLKLEVNPLVNSDNEVTMEIALLNDEQNGTQTIAGGGSNGGDLTVPRISTRELLTTVTVPNNETIVLGGLIITRNNNNKSGIPILSSIPYLGSLFRTTTDSKTRSELMVFLQPTVVNSSRSLDSVQADMDARYKVSDPLHGMADGPGVLPDPGAYEPVSDKGGRQPTSNPVIPPVETSSSTIKPTIRPAFRR
jgi:general secretion pathway protein D